MEYRQTSEGSVRVTVPVGSKDFTEIKNVCTPWRQYDQTTIVLPPSDGTYSDLAPHRPTFAQHHRPFGTAFLSLPQASEDDSGTMLRPVLVGWD